MTPNLPPRSRTSLNFFATAISARDQDTGFELPVYPHQRRLKPLVAISEIERVAALDAQELAVDARAVAIVAADDHVVAHAERRLAAVRAVRADGADVVHLPGPRLVAIDAAGQRAHRADIDARAALVAFEVVAVRRRDLAETTPRLTTPSAPTPMPSLQTRTQR